MPTLEAPEERLKKFKYRGKDVSMRRKERIAANLQLRKAKKDEQALKRRNISQFSNDLVSQVSVKEERNPPLKLIIEAGLIPKLVEFLKVAPLPNLQFEAAWALTNIASGTSEQTRAVVKGGAIQPLIELLSSPHLTVCEQAVWALGNIAGMGKAFTPPFTFCLLCTPSQITFLRNITWTLSNLCRNKNPYPCEQAVMQMLPALSQLLQHHDNEILSDTCWALSYLTEGHNERIHHVVAMGVLPRLVELMTSSELIILTPSLRTVGNVVTGTEQQTQMAIDAGMLKVLGQLLRHPKSSIQKEAAWAMSNAEFRVQKEAVWTVANFATGASQSQLTEADKLHEKEKLCLLMEEAGGIEKIESLQLHQNCHISQTALNIIEKHFG
ncbi:hypothetical protein A6R68_08240, partial [Neotoma lepida]